MTAAVDPRVTALTETVEEALRSFRGGLHHLPPLTETVLAGELVKALMPLLESQRTAVLEEAADAVSGMPAPDCSDFSDLDEAWESGASAAARRLREMANGEEG